MIDAELVDPEPGITASVGFEFLIHADERSPLHVVAIVPAVGQEEVWPLARLGEEARMLFVLVHDRRARKHLERDVGQADRTAALPALGDDFACLHAFRELR